MIIDKVYRRKVQSYADGSSLVISIPKEVKELMDLTSQYIASMEFKDTEKEIIVTFNEKVSNLTESEENNNIIERKLMSINDRLIFTIPIKKAKDYGIDEETIVELDGNVYKKMLIIRINGKDISLIDEVEENE